MQPTREQPRNAEAGRTWLVLVLPLLLAACGGQSADKTAPTISIASPASGAPVSGTVAVQLTAHDDTAVAKVQVYARSRGSSARGVLVGSATTEPYVVSWFTPGVPNGADLELVAVAEDAGGNKAESDPVRVRVSNQGVPSLSYLVAYTIPPKPAGTSSLTAASASGGALPSSTPSLGVLPPLGVDLAAVAARLSSSAPTVRPQADETRSFVAEWGWAPTPGVDGYAVYLATEDLAGPYTVQYRQTAGASGTQKYSKTLPTAKPGDTIYGLVTNVSGGASTESGYSNADAAKFIQVQTAASPTDGQTIADGRPILTWTANTQAAGYLYYLYDKHPWDPAAKQLWTNYPNSADALSATYPSTRDKLAPGTYYWWVAGIAFDAQGKADAFSYSEPRKIVVP